MRKFFLLSAIILSATAAHAGPNLTVASADIPPAASSPVQSSPTAPSSATTASSAQLPDAAAQAAKRQAMMEQKMAMQKQKQMAMRMAMQREMQAHPIRTRVHFAVIKVKRAFEDAFDFD